jgi:hypothetical protein
MLRPKARCRRPALATPVCRRARAMRPRRADPHHELTINAVRFCFCSGSGQSPRARVRARARRLLLCFTGAEAALQDASFSPQLTINVAQLLFFCSGQSPPARVRARVGSFIDCSARTRRDHSPGRQPPATPAPGARAPRKVCEAQQPSAPHHPSTITYLPHPKAKAWSVHGAPSRASSLTRTSARGVVARLQQKNIQLPPSILTTLVWLLQCAQPM